MLIRDTAFGDRDVCRMCVPVSLVQRTPSRPWWPDPKGSLRGFSGARRGGKSRGHGTRGPEIAPGRPIPRREEAAPDRRAEDSGVTLLQHSDAVRCNLNRRAPCGTVRLIADRPALAVPAHISHGKNSSTSYFPGHRSNRASIKVGGPPPLPATILRSITSHPRPPAAVRSRETLSR